MQHVIMGYLLATFFVSAAFAFPLIPDPQITPGDICTSNDPDFERYRYSEQVPYCYRKVYSSTKNRIYNTYNIPEQCHYRYTIDHLIPLALGGSNAEENLWPEHRLVKAQRPLLEYKLYRKLENGTISQSKAIDTIVEAKTENIKRLKQFFLKFKNEKNKMVKKEIDCDSVYINQEIAQATN